MEHNILAPGQVGPEKALDWPWAEGLRPLNLTLPSLTVAWPVGTFFFSRWVTALGTFLLRLEGALQGLLELATEGCGFLPGQVGLGRWRS